MVYETQMLQVAAGIDFDSIAPFVFVILIVVSQIFGALKKKGTKLETTALSADFHDPANRIILLPITNEDSKLVGLAGFILDQNFFKNTVLPKAIENSLPKFEDGEKVKLQVIVRDNQHRQVLPKDIATHPKIATCLKKSRLRRTC